MTDDEYESPGEIANRNVANVLSLSFQSRRFRVEAIAEFLSLSVDEVMDILSPDRIRREDVPVEKRIKALSWRGLVSEYQAAKATGLTIGSIRRLWRQYHIGYGPGWPDNEFIPLLGTYAPSDSSP